MICGHTSSNICLFTRKTNPVKGAAINLKFKATREEKITTL
jgi:hypothetical protein